jgi:uncharacterized protein DUF3828
MITSRELILSGTAAVLAVTLPHHAFAADDPADILTAIYTRAAKGKGDSGGTFVFENKAAKAKYLSKSLIALWAKADARRRKGDGGPVDFDPVTNSQDPDVKSFKVVAEKEADKAVIAVTFDSHQGQPAKPADRTIRYDFVREAGGWKIDEIKGAVDGEAWSLRAIITDFLKY